MVVVSLIKPQVDHPDNLFGMAVVVFEILAYLSSALYLLVVIEEIQMEIRS